MSVTEVVQALGSWDLRLKETTPDYVVAQLNPFGHVVVVDGEVDVAAAGNNLLAGARYVGVCREQDQTGEFERGGDGLIYWLGDEDGKGWTLLTEVSLTNATLAQVVTALLPPTVTVGTVFAQADPAARYTGKHVFQSRREALAIALAPFGAELKVKGDFTVDVGTPSQLYKTATPDTIIKRRDGGADVDLTAIGGTFNVGTSAKDYSTGITVVGQTIGTGSEPDTVFALATATAPSVPYKDPQGNAVKLHRLVSASTETQASAPATAAVSLNRFNRTTRSVKVTADQFEVQGSFAVGDATYVFDPDTGIVNPALEVFFRGQKLNPDIVRVTERTWPIVKGMTVAWRTDAGAWLDLTPWVVWETAGSHELVVGDLPRTLFKSGTPNGAVQDRVDAARGNPSTKVPKTPTGLALTTSSSANAVGRDSSVITATWNPVTQYVDNTTVALHHYELQYRPQFRAPLWTANFPTDGLTAELPVTAALGYDVQVRAVSTGGIPSAWSSTVPIVSAADSTGPATPSDPVVTQYLGLLRIYWNGLNSVGGAMPSDFNRVDVHVGTSSGFTASSSTLVSSLSAPGYAHVQAPYGSTRWVRFIAYDHNGNPSASSAVISGATVQAADGDIAALSVGKLTAGVMTADVTISGRVTTALTGARREMNSVGFQAFDASSNLLINLDGVNNLLTGLFQTDMPGNRRIVIGASGAVGELQFLAPDGTKAYIHAYTESTGIEAMQMGIPITGETNGFWNKIHFNTDEWANWQAQNLDMAYLFDGFFTVRQRSARSGGTNTTRLLINNGATQVYDPSGHNRFSVATDVTTFDTGGYARIRVEESTRTTYFGHGAGDAFGWITFTNGAEVGGVYRYSPQITFVTPQLSGGGVFAGSLSYQINDNGTGGGIHALTSNRSGYIPLIASAFTVSSDERLKQSIQPVSADFDGADIIRRFQLKTFERTPQRDDKGNPAPVKRELGVLAQEAPDEVVVDSGGSLGVDLGQSFWAAVGMLQKHDARLAALEKGKAA